MASRRSNGRSAARGGWASDRWREAEAQQALEAWRRSGLTLSAWARQEGVAYERIRRWRGVLSRAKGSKRAALLPVQLIDGEEASGGPTFEVELSRGLRVHVPAQFDEVALDRLLQVLETRG